MSRKRAVQSAGVSQPAGLPATKEWIQIDHADAADYEKDLEVFKQSLDFVKSGGR